MKKLLTVISAIIVFAACCFGFYYTREIVVFNNSFPACTEEIVFEGSEITDFDTLCSSIEPFKSLKKAELGSFPVYPEQSEQLSSIYPNVEFSYTPYMKLFNVGFAVASEEIDL